MLRRGHPGYAGTGAPQPQGLAQRIGAGLGGHREIPGCPAAYRQAALLGRFGGDLSRNTLAASIVRVGEAVQPIINLLRDHLLDADLVLGDETVIQVLKEPGRAAQSKSYLWVQMTGSGPPIRLFAHAPGRGGGQASSLYAGIKAGAALMSDGYEVYNAIAAVNGLTHLGCWAHARRYFVEAEAVIPKAACGPEQPATQFIAAIGALYAIESGGEGKRPDLAAAWAAPQGAQSAGAGKNRNAAGAPSAQRDAEQLAGQGAA